MGGDLRMVARVWWCRGWVSVGVVLGLEAMVLLYVFCWNETRGFDPFWHLYFGGSYQVDADDGVMMR